MSSPSSLHRVASTVVPSDASDAEPSLDCKKIVGDCRCEILVDVRPFSDVVKQDPRMWYMVEQVKMIGHNAFWGNNCLIDCNKRVGWKLNIIAQLPTSGDEVFGFVVYKVDSKQKILQIQYIAIAEGYRRHGIGSKLLKSLQNYASKVLTKSTVERVACACVPEAVEFYQKHNFRKCKRIIPDDGEAEMVQPDGTVETQIPLQFHMEWKVPRKNR